MSWTLILMNTLDLLSHYITDCRYFRIVHTYSLNVAFIFGHLLLCVIHTFYKRIEYD